jgi:sialic acid synthase SpsE
MRRSIVTRRAIAAGTPITMEDIDFKRPGDGYSPTQTDAVIGKTAVQDIPADEVIYPAMIQ